MIKFYGSLLVIWYVQLYAKIMLVVEFDTQLRYLKDVYLNKLTDNIL